MSDVALKTNVKCQTSNVALKYIIIYNPGQKILCQIVPL